MSQKTRLAELVSTPISRRKALMGTGVTLSAAVVGVMAGASNLLSAGPVQAADADAEKDIRILNTALGAEHEAVAAYQVGAESGLLAKDALALAIQFQGHHKEHIDLLSSTVEQLGGQAAVARTRYAFPLDKLKNQEDVLRFAAGLEKGAVSAYLGAVPLFGNGDLAKAAASILGDEAMHWAVLRYVLGDNPVPTAFVA